MRESEGEEPIDVPRDVLEAPDSVANRFFGFDGCRLKSAELSCPEDDRLRELFGTEADVGLKWFEAVPPDANLERDDDFGDFADGTSNIWADPVPSFAAVNVVAVDCVDKRSEEDVAFLSNVFGKLTSETCLCTLISNSGRPR